MVATLESIVEKFGEEMAPYAVGLMQHLAIAFWRIVDADDKVRVHHTLPGRHISRVHDLHWHPVGSHPGDAWCSRVQGRASAVNTHCPWVLLHAC